MDVMLTIIIVNWNGIDFLPNCLRSIVENPPSMSFEVIVVDNDSTDGSADWLRSQSTKSSFESINLKLIESGANLGFGRANNLAMKRTEGRVIFLLNPDTIVRKGAIDQLYFRLISSTKIGVTVPKLLHADGTLQPSVWPSPTPLTILSETILFRILPRRFYKGWLYGPHWDYSEERTVPIICAAAMMLKREVFDQVGGFDEDFHMYAEDLEYGMRISKMGWELRFTPNSEIHHLSGQSSAQRWTAVEKQVTIEKGYILFQKKSLPTWLWPLNLCARIVVFSLYLLHNIANRSEFDRYRKLIAANLKGFTSN